MTESSLVQIVGGTGSPRKTLVCIPQSGHAVAMFIRWKKLLKPVMDFIIVMLPGREERIMEEPLTSMKEITSLLVGELNERSDLDLVLYGHCSGGLIAYQLAHELKRAGGVQASALVISSTLAPHLVPLAPQLHRYDDDELRRYMENLSAHVTPRIPDAVWELFEPCIRADLEAVERADYSLSPLGVPLAFIRGAGDHLIERQHAESWQRYTSSDFSVNEIPGGHTLIETNPDGLAQELISITSR
jgi:medium-chain acyl-[acyl-carrier-protein] hydrolase